jgi:general secretion pathway protein G
MMMNRNKGFTLVEILIVVIILGILAAIVIPQFTEASNEARNSSLQSNLQTLRSQCELYKVQHRDTYPWYDADGNTDLAGTNDRLTGKTDATGAAGGTLGPYMQSVPLNPLANDDAANFADAAGAANDWVITAEEQIIPGHE